MGDPVELAGLVLVLLLRGEECTDDVLRDVLEDCFSITKVADILLFLGRMALGSLWSEVGWVVLLMMISGRVGE